MKSHTGVVYELIDPRSGQCRYVGQTFDSDRRRSSHQSLKPLYQNNNDLHYWKHSLHAAGLKPDYRIIEDGISIDTINDRERFWCKQRADAGCVLLNMAVGHIRKSDLLGVPEREALAQSAEELRSMMFALLDRFAWKLPLHHPAHKNLSMCIDRMLKVKHAFED